MNLLPEWPYGRACVGISTFHGFFFCAVRNLSGYQLLLLRFYGKSLFYCPRRMNGYCISIHILLTVGECWWGWGIWIAVMRKSFAACSGWLFAVISETALKIWMFYACCWRWQDSDGKPLTKWNFSNWNNRDKMFEFVERKKEWFCSKNKLKDSYRSCLQHHAPKKSLFH